MSIDVKRVAKTIKVDVQRHSINVSKRPKTINIHAGGRRGLPGVSDKNYQTSFTNTSELTVDHNLNKYPAVTVIDSANDTVSAAPRYTSLNQVVLTFPHSFSGKVICN